MTTFGDQVRQYGGVPVGVDRLATIFNKDNIWFVDQMNGATAHGGQKPDDAFALPSEAVSAATAEGIIYIRPAWTIASADAHYDDNITIPVTKPLIQLIGAGAGTVPGYRGSAQIQPASATSHIISVDAAGVVIENLHLNNTGGGTGYCCVEARRETGSQAVALQVRNCRIINTTSGVGDTGTSIQGAIGLGTTQYCVIENNIFLDCYNSITMWATGGSPQNYTIRGNIIAGKPSNRSTDIMIGMTADTCIGHSIIGNYFCDGLPDAGGYNMFIYDFYSGTSSATGIISGNHFPTLTGNAFDGSQCTLSAGWFFTGNYYDGVDSAAGYGLGTKD